MVRRLVPIRRRLATAGLLLVITSACADVSSPDASVAPTAPPSLFIGADSGFEGRTDLYLDRIEIEALPAS